MSVGLEYIKKIDPHHRQTLVLQPSGMPYATMTCPYKNAPCSLHWCALYDKDTQLCGMLLTYLQTAKMISNETVKRDISRKKLNVKHSIRKR